MITPAYLKQDNSIAIVAPARWIEEDKYDHIISIIEKQGYKVVRGNSTRLKHGPFAGTDEERKKDLQEMLDNPEIKAIFCLRGGYGTIRIIEDLDFSEFKKKPKWLIGFSDISILHNAIHNLGIQSIHGQMPLNFTGRLLNKGLDKLFEALSGQTLSYELEPSRLNREGTTKGLIVGGNLAIFNSLIGTEYDVNTEGKILFIEEVGEYLYRFDRLMHHLKMSGKLDDLKGLIVGGLSELKDNEPAFGQSAEEIIFTLVKEFDYPVCFGFPAGHIKENYPLIFGAKVLMKITNTESIIELLA
ncbi:MAG: LD-carboxypeptidase [Salinivirgaceae bacterium]|jgi:muramoyltetrapeptide carboxypeptidase|nr:LD-carboxypeptidase [Salinivirgaceae bacterium]